MLSLLLFFFASGSIIPDVRSALAQKDFALAEKHLAEHRAARGITPELLEAHSWLGRGALAARNFDQAERYAAETRGLALDQLKTRGLDAERHLPIALGASIEVEAQLKAARGERDQAVSFLREELERWRATSIRTRIQKNIHLLSLEGKPAPPLEVKEWIGSQPAPLEKLKGRPVLLFFWAHWCGDCKAQAPILSRLAGAYGARGLAVIGPTQRYGYTARGQDATPAEEKPYIEAIHKRHYADLSQMTVPLSEENFRNYGSSTTPTIVLIDRQGIVKLYHPGNLTYEALAEKIEKLL
ncbi:MAG: TlpA family protein disulfide reductase [Acidobacteria bacterium]|nr:TlpA family protein disulfide reductase [Acidobacteriota bacterium]